MRTTRGVTVLSLLSFFMLMISSRAQQPLQTTAPAIRDIGAFLPAAAEVPGWTPQGAPRRFRGEDLFVYIDGGAEIYHEYGFREVVTQDYGDPDGRTVALEIFEMSDSAAAFGMYTFKSSGKGRSAGLGQDSELEDYYLNFWKGRYLVTATGSDESPVSLAGVLAVGRAANGRIEESGSRPTGASLLPPEWAGPRLKYLRGALGLFNIHPFFTKDVFRFREGVAGGNGPARVFVFRYESPDEARSRFGDVRTAFAGSPAYRDVRQIRGGPLEASTSKGTPVRVEAFADVIAVILGEMPGVSWGEVLDRLKKQRSSLEF